MAITEEPIIPVDPATSGEPAKKVTTLDAKEPKTKKVSAQNKRTSPTHPPYFEMIKDAIVTLKDRTGSSQYAIAKFIEDKQKNLPSNFRKALLHQLKKLVANDKLVKVKNSFKFPSARSSKPVAPIKKKSPPVPKPKTKSIGTKEKKAGVPKPKLKAKTIAVKSRTVTKTATPVKAKTATKRKAPEKAKTEKKPAAKVAKTSTKSTPVKKTAVAPPTKMVAAAKNVKPKSIKSPAKKAALKKGKK